VTAAKRPLGRRIARGIARAISLVIAILLVALIVGYVRSGNDCGKLPPPTNPIRAIVYCEYGTADNLRLETVEKPVPNDVQMLVKVHAAAVNPLDWHFIRGTPYVMRLDSGLRKPKNTRLGVDFAGTVEAVGKNVTTFKPGDEIFGGRRGAFGEYVVVWGDQTVARKPANISFEQAAGVPIAGVTALQALRDQAKVQPGQKVLINGASGGVGTFAVQIAKSYGAEVTGVCSGRNVEMVTSLGADHVIDYTKDDFTKGDVRYDAIIDNVGNRGILECKRVLAPNGRYILVGGGGPDRGNWIGALGGPIKAFVLGPFVKQEMGFFVADLNKADLKVLADMMEAGKVTPVIDRKYPLAQVPDAIKYLEEGHARGKVIITME
jgi:NADPH:quinone reductase-like Zn-dependent oxidoreductase